MPCLPGCHTSPHQPPNTPHHILKGCLTCRTTLTDQWKENKRPPFHREGQASQGCECTPALNNSFPGVRALQRHAACQIYIKPGLSRLSKANGIHQINFLRDVFQPRSISESLNTQVIFYYMLSESPILFMQSSYHHL